MVERLHDSLEAFALLAEHIFLGNPDRVKEERARRNATAAHLVLVTTDSESRGSLGHDEEIERSTALWRFLSLGDNFGSNNNKVGERSVGAPDLGTVNHVALLSVASLADSLGLDARNV